MKMKKAEYLKQNFSKEELAAAISTILENGRETCSYENQINIDEWMTYPGAFIYGPKIWKNVYEIMNIMVYQMTVDEIRQFILQLLTDN